MTTVLPQKIILKSATTIREMTYLKSKIKDFLEFVVFSRYRLSYIPPSQEGRPGWERVLVNSPV